MVIIVVALYKNYFFKLRSSAGVLVAFDVALAGIKVSVYVFFTTQFYYFKHLVWCPVIKLIST